MRTSTIVAVLAAASLTQGCHTGAGGESQSSAPAAPVVAGAEPQSLVAPTSRPTGPVEFKPVLDLAQGGGAQPQLRHGRVAESAEWPASLYATFPTARGTAACTAALVGPEAMLTAGHCVPDVGGVTFSFKGQSRPYTATCVQHPQYVSNADASADYALCKLDRPLVQPTGFKFETISTTGFDGLTGKTIILTGYGCVGDAVANAQFDGKYRIGTNTVDETSASTTRRRGPAFYTGKEDNNILTADDPNLANLCPGDSGGPAFLRTGGTGDQFSNRVIAGVNSRVFYTSPARTAYGSSLISATSGPDFQGWAEDWAKNIARVAVCGLNGVGTVANCRS
jgi:hypothetical protein